MEERKAIVKASLDDLGGKEEYAGERKVTHKDVKSGAKRGRGRPMKKGPQKTESDAL